MIFSLSVNSSYAVSRIDPFGTLIIAPFSKVTDPYILTLLSFILVISICWSRYKSKQFKNLLNPIFILSSILGSELNFAINVCISINKNSKHFAVNLNIIGVFADD